MDMHEAIATIEIQQVLARYSRGIDRADFAMAKNAYHADATDEHGPLRGNAHEVLDEIETALADVAICQHQIAHSLIEIDGDHAVVESYFTSLHVHKDEAAGEELVFGRYLDAFERRDGEWKIAERVVIVDHTRTSPRRPWPGEASFRRGGRGAPDASDNSFEGT